MKDIDIENVKGGNVYKIHMKQIRTLPNASNTIQVNQQQQACRKKEMNKQVYKCTNNKWLE